MARRPAGTVDEYAAPSKCSHYWLIESGISPTSKGVCKSCGAEKYFSNSYRPNLVEDRPEHHKKERESRERATEKATPSADVSSDIDRIFIRLEDVEETALGDRQ